MHSDSRFAILLFLDPPPSACRFTFVSALYRLCVPDEFARGERVPAWVARLHLPPRSTLVALSAIGGRSKLPLQNYFLYVNICVCTGPVSSGVEMKTLPVNRWKRTVTVPVLFLRGDTLSTDSTFASARAAARGARRV